MAELLKNRYNEAFFEGFYAACSRVLPELKVARLNEAIHARGWDELELKQRMRRISTCLRSELPTDWKKATYVLCDLTDILSEEAKGQELEYVCLPDVVEQYGLKDVEFSCMALEKLTQFTTSEFAIRPFIAQDKEGMMSRMRQWSEHEHHGVRRWSSEGCRPRLPWGMALKDLQDDPSSILAILENLKSDSSAFVRRSVANNLNDISKDHPELVAGLAAQWKGELPETDALLKHGCRTLLKSGDPTAMELFGFPPPDQIRVNSFRVLTSQVKWGGDLQFACELENRSGSDIKLRLEYAMYYLRSNGKQSRKVFKISERTLEPGETLQIQRKQSFKAISTRRYYPGEQGVALVINGHEMCRSSFELM